jgi:O-antigen ligase
MPTILAIAALFLLATDALDMNLSILPGLSAKNLIIYLIAVLLALRMVVSRASITAAGQMQVAFLAMILYAMVTIAVSALLVEYPRFDVMQAVLRLKTALIDYYIFFMVFLFGVRTADDAMKVLKGLLLGSLFVNLLTIVDAMGLADIGFRVREDGRTGGAIGESNQYAVFILMFMPATIAAAVAASGLQRLFWVGATFVAAFALVTTASRGGFVGLAMAFATGAYLYRHLVSYSRAAAWALGILVLLVVVVAFSPYAGLLAERTIGEARSFDANSASSGRSEIWANLFAVMVEAPVTFITGYGWDVYWSMPFAFSPHNHYLALWFNLGLVGLLCGTYLLFSAIYRARRASEHAKRPYRGQLIAFVLGGVGVATAVFFVDLYAPWYYFWMYGGLMMRLSLCVNEAPAPVPERAPRARLPTIQRDPYGWGQPGARS